MLNVGVAYATSEEQAWLNISVIEGATIKEAIEMSGILKKFPEIDLDKQKVGIFGEIKNLSTLIEDGDRVEIYRPIKIDPEHVEHNKYKLRRIAPVVEKLN
jgi:uncharacterized protein